MARAPRVIAGIARPRAVLVWSACILGAMGLCSCGPARGGRRAAPLEPPRHWRPLFDGKSLTGWRNSQFGGDGEIRVKDGAIHMEMGLPATGVTYTGKVPRDNYEITLEAIRVDGSDFFCGLTFPVGDDHMSLILGGWGGSLVGLSCIDEKDASENKTERTIHFDDGRWYGVRLRVTAGKIRVWLDGKQIIDVSRPGHRISIRSEVEPSLPLGIATWNTHGAARNIRIGTLESAAP